MLALYNNSIYCVFFEGDTLNEALKLHLAFGIRLMYETCVKHLPMDNRPGKSITAQLYFPNVLKQSKWSLLWSLYSQSCPLASSPLCPYQEISTFHSQAAFSRGTLEHVRWYKCWIPHRHQLGINTLAN